MIIRVDILSMPTQQMLYSSDPGGRSGVNAGKPYQLTYYERKEECICRGCRSMAAIVNVRTRPCAVEWSSKSKSTVPEVAV